MRSLISRWRFMSHNCLVYLDDNIFRHASWPCVFSRLQSYPTFWLILGWSRTEREHLVLGVRPNGDVARYRDQNYPTHISSSASLSKKNRSGTLSSLIFVGRGGYMNLARLAGFIISLSLAVVPISPYFHLRNIAFIHSSPRWDASFIFIAALSHELKFWLQHIDSFNR